MRKRLITCIFLKNGIIVRSEDFKNHQVIGNPINQVKRFSDWAVDEIIYIDISKTTIHDNRRDDHMVKISENKFDLIFLSLQFYLKIKLYHTNLAQI